MGETLKDRIARIITYYVSVALVALVVGVCVGVAVSRHIFDKKMDEAVLVGGFVHKGKVYQVQEKVVRE